MDSDKVQVIFQWLIPRLITEAWSFVDAFQYLQKFIQHFLQISTTLHCLPKANLKLEWSNKHKKTF